MKDLKPRALLGEIEDLLRTTPSVEDFRNMGDAELSWLGRASAVIGQWSLPKTIPFSGHVNNIMLRRDVYIIGARLAALAVLHEARHDLRMKTEGPVTTPIGAGGVFQYFDELRKLIETANSEIFFVDPYLDAEFVSRYLPHVSPTVSIRLLGQHRMAQLKPAVATYLKQVQNAVIEVRAAASPVHDRYLFVDKVACYQSGASFKDGAKKSPTTLTQITDAFGVVLATYEALWMNGTP